MRTLFCFVTSLLFFLCAAAQKPTISSFSPDPVCQGETVTITGTNFTGATAVKIGTDDAASFKVNSTTTITATVSYQASTGTVIVTTSKGDDTSQNKITITPAPKPVLIDINNSKAPFTNCDGNANYQLFVSNNSIQNGGSADYDIDWGDNTPHFTATDWPVNALTIHPYNGQGYFDIIFTITPKSNKCPKTTKYKFYNGTNPLANITTTTPTLGLCAPHTLVFVIDRWSNNAANTFYTLDFGDGTDTVLQHPLNLADTAQFVPHTYIQSSCPKNGTGYYTAILTPNNGCTTDYTVNSINIIEKAKADFKTQPDTACINDAVCFLNQTTNGYSGTNCNTISVYTWDFGDGGPTSGLENPLCHKYANAGSYPVTLIAYNPGCGGDTITKPVIVNPISPIPTISSSPINYCQGQPAIPLTATGNGLLWYTSSSGGTGNPTAPTPSTVNTGTLTYYVSQTLTNNCESPRVSIPVTVTALPAAPTVVTPVQLCEGTPASQLSALGNSLLWYTTANGGTGSTTAPTPATTTTGNTIYYVSQTGNGCESGRAAITVVVNAAPVFTATSNNPRQCGVADGSIQLKGLTANVTYTVAYTDGTNKSFTQTADGNGNINISNLPSGLYDNLTVTAFGCPSAKQGPFTLSSPNPPATPVLTSNGPLCSGEKLQLNATTTTQGTETWSWSGQNSFSSTQQNPSIENVPVAASGTYHATVTINNCTSAAGDIIVIINETPATPNITSNSPICSGEIITLTNTTANNSVAYIWSGPNSFASMDQNPSIPNATTAASGTYKVKATLGTCSSEGSTIVTVNELPVISNASSRDPTQCASTTGNITLKGLKGSSIFTVTYTKNSTQVNQTITSDNSGNVVIDGLTAGTYDAIQVSLNSCLSNKEGPFTLKDPTSPPAPVITGSAPICSGSPLTLSVAEVNGDSYSWTGPGNYTNTTSQITIPNATLANGGLYSVTITVAGCISEPSTTTAVINPTPATPAISSNSPVCSGNDIIFSNASNEAGVTYTWSGPNGFTSTDKAPVITAATEAATGTYQVIDSLGTCFSKATTDVTVNETPAITGIDSSNPTQCASATGSITLKGLSASTTYTVHYTKNGTPANTDITTNGSGNLVIASLASGMYDALSVSINNCVSNTKGPITLNDPNPPPAPTVSSNGPLCAGGTLNLTATSNDNGTYAWSGPGSFSSADQMPQITNVTAANAGPYNVTITVNNCTSPAGSVNVIVNPLAAAPAASTPVEYCINTPATPLSATATNDGTLSWFTVASEGNPSAIAPTPVTSLPGSVFYYVSQTSTEGCEGARTPIEVITHPDAKASFSPLQTLGCSPFPITDNIINLQLFPDNNGSYQWYANNVLIGSDKIFPGYTIQKDHDSVNIKLKAVSLFGCRDDSTATEFFTYQLPKTAFTASTAGGCGPITASFTNKTSDASAFNFKWIFGNGQTSTDENPQPVTFATNPSYGDTIYHVTLLGYTVCDTITATTDILVKSKPKSLFAPDKTNGCSPMKVHFDNISKGFGTGYQWFFGDGSKTDTTTDNSSVEHTYITGVQDTFYAKMVATNDCGTDTSIIAIVVSPNKVKLNVVVNGNQTTGCVPHTVQFINRSSGAATFAWDFGDGDKTNTTANIDTVTHTYTKSGTFTATIFASNGCSDTTTTETITVFNKPSAGFAAQPLSACIGDTVSFTNQASNYSSLLWRFGDNATSVIADPVHAYSVAGSYSAVLIAQKQYENGTVCSDTATKVISIVDKLPGTFTASATAGTCVPFTVTFTNTILPSVLTTWSFDDGTTATGDVVTHTFTTPGTYTVSMQAKHPAGCMYEAGKTITVKAPAGSISYTSGFVCNSTPVRFESNTTNTDSVEWNFGDGDILTTKDRVVYHVFSKPGSFVPSANLISVNGCLVPVATNDTVKVDYIQAGFAQQQDVVCGKTTVHFSDTSVAFFGISQWQWNLGDGTTSSLQNPVHNYSASGVLPIQLIAVSNSGCADTAAISLSVKVNDKPIATITGPSTACDGMPIPYTSSVSSIDSISLYQWTITGNASYNTSSIVHTFPNAGNYTIQLIAGTTHGCYDTVTKPVIVSTTPTVTASNDVTICRGAATALMVSGTASQYNWKTDTTLSCTACANPLAAPFSTTQYLVTGTSANGCSRTDSVLITVVQPFMLTVSAGDSICIGQSKQLSVSGAYEYTWSPAAKLDDSTSQHPVATPLASTTYSVTGTDDHHCFTDTKTVVVGVGQYPTVSLGQDTLLSTGTIFPLHSVITEGPIQAYVWSPADNLSCSNCAVPDVNVKKSVCYSVTATNYYGCSGRDTVCIKVFCQSGQVFIPNIFTPDGDGVNDKLIVQGKGIALIRSFRIFNRWGQVVFEKSGFAPNDASSGWDGRVNGNLATPDVYVYTCDVVCDDGTVYPLKGNVAIVK